MMGVSFDEGTISGNHLDSSNEHFTVKYDYVKIRFNVMIKIYYVMCLLVILIMSSVSVQCHHQKHIFSFP